MNHIAIGFLHLGMMMLSVGCAFIPGNSLSAFNWFAAGFAACCALVRFEDAWEVRRATSPAPRDEEER